MKKFLLLFLLFCGTAFAQTTDRFERPFYRSGSDTLITGASIYIVNSSTGDSLLLTEHATKPGVYYRNSVAYGSYKIYVNGALSTTAYPFGISRARTFIEAIDSDGDNKIQAGSFENGAVVAADLASTLDLSGKSVTLGTGELSTNEYADGSVTLPKIGDDVLAYVATGGDFNSDSLRVIVGDSVATLSADGVTIINDGTFKQKVFPTRTALAAVSADSVGMVATVLDQGTWQFSDSIFSELDSIIAIPASVDGKQWVRTEALQKKGYVNFGWTNPDGSGATNIRNKLAAAVALAKGDSGRVYIPQPERWYMFTGDPIPLGGQSGLIIEGEHSGRGITFKIAGDDTMFQALTQSNDIIFRNLSVRGNGKSATGGVFLQMPENASSKYTIEYCFFDSLKTVGELVDLTGMYFVNTEVRNTMYGNRAGYNSDSHVYDRSYFSRIDTVIQVGYDNRGSHDGMQVINCTFGQDSVIFHWKSGTGQITVKNGYFELIGNLFISSGAPLIKFEDTKIQNLQTKGFDLAANTFLTLNNLNVEATGTFNTTPFVLFNSESGIYFHSQGIYSTGAGALTVSRNGGHTEILSDATVEWDREQRQLFNANLLSADSLDPYIEVKYYTSDNKYIQTWRDVGITSNTLQNYVYIKYDGSRPVFGMAPYGYIKMAANAPADLAVLPPEDTRFGALIFENSTTGNDKLLIGVKDIASNHRYYDVIGGNFLDNNTVMEGVGSFAGTDVTDTLTFTDSHADSEYVVVTPITTNPGAVGQMSAVIGTGRIVVYRDSTGVPNLQYYYIRRKRIR
jgi:hypothetical protein